MVGRALQVYLAIQCERRFTMLRNKYTTMKRKIKCTPLESGAADIPVWPLYSLMGFLDTYIIPRRKVGNVYEKQNQGAQNGEQNTVIETETEGVDSDGTNNPTQNTEVHVEIDTTDNYQNVQSPTSVNDSFNQIISRPRCRLQNRLTNVQSEVKASRDYYLKDISSEIHRIDTILKSKLRKIFGDNDYGISNRERCNWFTDIITKEDCSYRAAMCLRENSWGLCVYGVSHPVLWEQFEISDIDQLTEPEKLNMSFCKT
ncbi:hypothetical protein FQA39_LY06970 [Lamprigera yunnana]|nr:hypothetical protein FQA39_LY06970 [Lamprigera yunnana]